MELIADAGPVRQFLVYLDHIGLDSAAPAAVSARLIVELLESASEVMQWPDLAIRFVEWLNPRGFGPMSMLGEHCSTFAERYRLSRRYVHLENNAISFGEASAGNEISLYCTVRPALRPRAHQFVEGLIALQVRYARSLLGPGWAPLRVEFAHTCPASLLAQRRYFRCPVTYDADRSALVVRRADFLRPSAKGNKEALAFLEKHLAERAMRWPSDLQGQVQNLIASQLAGGAVSLNGVAILLGVSSRTLQRRLTEQGTDFGKLLVYVRVQVVRDHLAQRPPPSIGRLCHLLGYSDPSVASRFIRAQFGASARTMLHAAEANDFKSQSFEKANFQPKRFS